MKAVTIDRYGGPEVMTLGERPEPTLRPRDVLIEVHAASLNPVDFKLREGKVKLIVKPPMPIGLGCDVAGVVREIGPDVRRFAVGDAVFARLEKDRMGGLAERVAVDEAVVALKPTRLSFPEAAAIPLAGLTALQALRDVARLKPDQRVLIHAGAGGVGSLAIQLGKILGLQVATTTSTRNLELVRSLGADEVVDYTTENVSARMLDLDAVLDTLGGDSEIASLAMVRPGGVVVGVSGLPDAAFARDCLPAWARALIWLGTRKRRRAEARAQARFVFLWMRPDGDELAELAAWIDAERLRPVIHQTYPLAQFADAFTELERGHARGKIVVTMG